MWGSHILRPWDGTIWSTQRCQAKSLKYSLCWTAVLTVFLSNRHRRSNPPACSTHRDIYVSKRRTAEMDEWSQEADRVLSHFQILSSKYDNCDESSTGSGVRRLGHQLWSIWTKNWIANTSKPTKREGGQGSPPHAPHTQEESAHSREMASVVDTNRAFVSDGAAAPLAGERTHDTCWKTCWGLGERLSFLWDFNKQISLWPKNGDSQFLGRLRSPGYPRRKGSGALEEEKGVWGSGGG